MPRTSYMVVTALVAATSAVVVLNNPLSAAKPASTSAGTAVFHDGSTDTIGSDGAGAYAGVFDRDGNFSFDTGTIRAVSFTFGAPLALFGNAQAPAGATVPSNGPTTQVRFQTLVTGGVGGIGTVLTTGIRSVKFQLPNTGPGKASAFTLDFRGNALLDDNGDGVANDPCLPAGSSTCSTDGTEMSKMWVVCTAPANDGKCARWTLTPCDGSCGDQNADPDPTGIGHPVGQLYGTFKAPVGNSRIARFAMQWGMDICRVTAGITCP